MIKNFVFEGTELSTGVKVRSVVTFIESQQEVAWDSDEAMVLMRARAEISMESALAANRRIPNPDVDGLVLLRIDDVYEDELPDSDGRINLPDEHMSEADWNKQERRLA